MSIVATTPSARLLRFGVFELEPASGELRREGRRVRLAPQPFAVLLQLTTHAGQVVRREELYSLLWGEGTFVEFDTALNSCVRKIRRALGDDAQNPRFVETLPRRGYRFIAPVEAVGDPPVELSANSAVSGAGAEAKPEIDGRTAQEHGAPPLASFWRRKVARLGLLAPALIFLSLIPLSLVVLRARPESAGQELEPQRLVVLPFQDLGHDSPYFSDGLVEELTTRLGRLDREQLHVVARGSVGQLVAQGKNPMEIGEALAADYLVEGSVRWDGEMLRVAARLVQGADQSLLWSASYDYTPQRALVVQSELASRVSGAVASQLLPGLETDRSGGVGAGETNAAAAEALLKGRYHLNRWSAESARTASNFCRQALGHDPGLASAHAGLATASNFLRFNSEVDAAEVHELARESAQQALRLAPDLTEAHLALAAVRLYYDWDLEAAGSSLRRALELAPGQADVHSQHAAWLAAAGRYEAAVEASKVAQQLDPLTQSVAADLGWYLNYAGRYDAAIVECSRALELEPHNGWSQWGLHEAYRQQGRHGKALAAAPMIFGSVNDDAPHGASRDPRAAELALQRRVRRRLEKLQELQGERAVEPYALAVHHALLGQAEASLNHLHEAIRQRSWWMLYLEADPRLASLQDEPRFQVLVRQVRG